MPVSGNIATGIVNVVVKGVDKLQQQMEQTRKTTTQNLAAQEKLWQTGRMQPFIRSQMEVEKRQEALANKEKAYRRELELTSKHGGWGKALFGVEQMLGKVGKLHNAFQAVGNVGNAIGNRAAMGFGALAGGILASVRVADPIGFQRLEIAIGRVTIHIGRIFIPILRDLTRWLNGVANWLASMTDEQRQMALTITKVALGVLAFLAVGGQLLGLLPVLTTVVMVAGKAFLFFWSSAGGPVTLVVAGVAAIIAAVGALGVGLVVLSGRTQKFWDFFKKAWENVKALWKTIVEALKPVIEEYGKFFDEMVEMGKGFMTQLVEQAKSIWASVGKVIKALAPILGVILKVYMAIYWVIGKVWLLQYTLIGKVIEVIAWLIEKVMEFYNTITEGFGGVSGVFGVFTDLFAEIWEAISEVGTALYEVFTQGKGLVGDLIDALQPLIGPIWEAIVDAVKMILPMLRTVVNFVVDMITKTVAGLSAILRVAARVLRGEIRPSRLADALTEEFEAAQARIARRRREREEADKKKRDGAKLERKGGGDFAPMLQQKTEMFGISDAFKRVQQSQIQDPAKALEQERLNIARGTNRKLEEIYAKMQEFNIGLR